MRNSTFIPVLACAFLVAGIAAPRLGVAQVDTGGQQVVVHGQGSARQMVKRGGKLMPLREALGVVVPPSYSINLPNAGPWVDSPVSWHAHRTIADALKEMLAKYPNLAADVDTDIRLVTVTERTSSFGAPLAAVPAPVPPAAAVPAPVKKRSQLPAAPDASIPAARPFGTQARLLEQLAASSPAMPVAADAPAPAPAPAPISRLPAVSAPAVAAAGSDQLPTRPSLSAGEVQIEQSRAPSPVHHWQIGPSDRTVKAALARWATEAGWQFVWDVPTDFAVDASATVDGTLEEALAAVVQALKRSQVPIQVILYKGNKVVRVVGEGAA
jgi:hypothetical protein